MTSKTKKNSNKHKVKIKKTKKINSSLNEENLIVCSGYKSFEQQLEDLFKKNKINTI